jgi:hypothetical protein
MRQRPDPSEAAPYYARYVDRVPDGDIVRTLETQLDETLGLLGKISEERSLRRYAPGKWSVRELLSHVTDTERVFVHRALWFARGFDTALPSFEQETAVAAAGADAVSWARHVEEFRAVRLATVPLFRNLPAEAWAKKGVASGNPVTVRALAWITAGHAAHHAAVLKERYLSP